MEKFALCKSPLERKALSRLSFHGNLAISLTNSSPALFIGWFLGPWFIRRLEWMCRSEITFVFVFICLHHSWNGVGCIISCCCIGLFVCLFVVFVIACHCKITAYVGDNKLILILSYLILTERTSVSTVFLSAAASAAPPDIPTVTGR